MQFSSFCWILNFFPLLYSPFTTQMTKGASPFLMYIYISFRSYMFWRCLFKLLCVFSSPFPIVLTQIWIFLPSFRIFTVDLVFLVFRSSLVRFPLFCPLLFFGLCLPRSFVAGRNGMRSHTGFSEFCLVFKVIWSLKLCCLRILYRFIFFLFYIFWRKIGRQ